MKRCPKCLKAYDDSWGVCLGDSTLLVVDGFAPIQPVNQSAESSGLFCPFCKETIKPGASVCPHCRKELGASVIIEGIGALITIPLLIFLVWLSVGLFYNVNGLRSDANGQEFRQRAKGYNQTLDKIESALLKFTSDSSK